MKIGEVLAKWRFIAQRDLRSVAKEIGISAATLMRIEHGMGTDSRTMTRLMIWLFTEKEDGKV